MINQIKWAERNLQEAKSELRTLTFKDVIPNNVEVPAIPTIIEIREMRALLIEIDYNAGMIRAYLRIVEEEMI